MLRIHDDYVREHVLDGNFGLEMESLRVLGDGKFAHTPHPFPGDAHIVKDFCENQTEINTSVHDSVPGAIRELESHSRRICQELQGRSPKEYLWPFSNPPYIADEEDIPAAVFDGQHLSKTAYREYLSEKYGRYKMTFSGIHVNFSFSEELLRASHEAEERQGVTEDFREYKDRLYLELAKGMAAYGWILVAVTAASPVLDSSFMEKGVYGQDVFTGMASVRCSEMGYWNEFAPIFHYESVDAYADSIQRYVSRGLLKAPSELYYPIRLKPRGENSLETLRLGGVDHIELRMFDLNPLCESGVEEKDIRFAQLLMIWLAARPSPVFRQKEQIQAIQNFKNAAHYDLKTVKILLPDGENDSVAASALRVIGEMEEFFGELGLPVREVLEFEREKFTDAQNRYAWVIRDRFKDGFVEKALSFAKERQER